MKAFYCHHFVLPLPEGHRFPMSKYARLHERVTALAPVLGIELLEPRAATDAELQRVHAAHYVRAMREGSADEALMRRIGFPWSAAMVERSRRSSGGTMMALEAALSGEGIAVNLAGGTHHAGHERGGGYCVFNDAVVAARHVQSLGLARRLLVVDLDVHHGNGTAELCANDATVFTFSIHAGRNYPAVKPDSDLDVALPDGTEDEAYLEALSTHLPRAIARAQADAVIYLAGADPFAGDRLGYLSLSKAGLAERDRQVLDACRRHGLPLAVCMAGGYAPDVEDIVDIHETTVRLAAAHWHERAGPA
jgi:acetoin utilization deacetylase AcuC-like enzyme